VDNTLLVRSLERRRDILTHLQCRRDRQRSTRQPTLERVALDELEDKEANPVGFLQTVNARDVRMIERGHESRLLLESVEASRILACLIEQELDGNVTPETVVARTVYLAHPPGAESANDLVSA